MYLFYFIFMLFYFLLYYFYRGIVLQVTLSDGDYYMRSGHHLHVHPFYLFSAVYLSP